MPSFVSPKAWREATNLSRNAAGKLAGFEGRNPSKTWERWENGEIEAKATIIEAIEKASDGQVTAASWAAVRRDYLLKTGEPPSKRIAAHQTMLGKAA